MHLGAGWANAVPAAAMPASYSVLVAMACRQCGYTGLLHLQTVPSLTNGDEVISHHCSKTCPGVLGELRSIGNDGPGYLQSGYCVQAENEAKEPGGLSTCGNALQFFSYLVLVSN